MLTLPNQPTKVRVIWAPAMAPMLPPTAITANRRLACSSRKMSAMKLQKTATTNRLKTLTQTKKTFESASDLVSPCVRQTKKKSSRFRPKKR